MKNRLLKQLGILFFLSISIQAKEVYVAPNGSDSNSGTIDQPFASIYKAQSVVSAGDTVYLRGGTYQLDESDISSVQKSIFACISYLYKSGSPGNPIKYWNYPGETPVFNLEAVKPANKRVACFYITGRYLHLKGIEITGVQVTILGHTESYCIYSRGSHNTFEKISMHDNKGTGIRHNIGGYNLFLNCDAYNNHDDVSEDGRGGNTDGFGCHPNSGGKGNVFRGCRAWFNSDDGFDLIRAKEAVVFENCWAFFNGYSQHFQSLGDGSGFKAGGYAYDAESTLPNPVPVHTIQHCLAVRNKSKGFYANHHLTGNIWLNNSAYGNGYNYDMVNRESPQSQNINVDGYDHVLKNNLSYKGYSRETRHYNPALNTSITNSFDMNLTLTNDDFVSLDESLLMDPRNADGSLPDTDFMKLTSNSSALDAGTDIGFPFFGNAPDLGAFERDEEHMSVGTDVSDSKALLLYPNPAKNKVFIQAAEPITVLQIFNLEGRIVLSKEVHDTHCALDISDLPNGCYFVHIQTPSSVETIKMIKQ